MPKSNPEHSMCIGPGEFRALLLVGHVKVSFRHSTRRPAVGDLVEVRDCTATARDQAEHARQARYTEVLSVDSGDDVATTLKLRKGD